MYRPRQQEINAFESPSLKDAGRQVGRGIDLVVRETADKLDSFEEKAMGWLFPSGIEGPHRVRGTQVGFGIGFAADVLSYFTGFTNSYETMRMTQLGTTVGFGGVVLDVLIWCLNNYLDSQKACRSLNR
jgi:hypothetical protein